MVRKQRTTPPHPISTHLRNNVKIVLPVSALKMMDEKTDMEILPEDISLVHRSYGGQRGQNSKPEDSFKRHESWRYYICNGRQIGYFIELLKSIQFRKSHMAHCMCPLCALSCFLSCLVSSPHPSGLPRTYHCASCMENLSWCSLRYLGRSCQ